MSSPQTLQSPVLVIAQGPKILQVHPEYPHTFISIYACDALGEPLPSYAALSGTFDVSVLSNNCPVYQEPDDHQINLNKPEDISIGGNLLKVKVTPSSVSGATHYRISVTQNIS